MFRGVRGAITLKKIKNKTFCRHRRLLKKIIHENEIEPEQVASVFISVTDDITEAFPARANADNGRLEICSCYVYEGNHSS